MHSNADSKQQVNPGYTGGAGPQLYPSPPIDYCESPLSINACFDDQEQPLTYAAQQALFDQRQYRRASEAPSAIPSQTTTANIHAYARRAPSPAPTVDPSCFPQQIRVILLFPLRPLRRIPLKRLGRTTRRRFLGHRHSSNDVQGAGRGRNPQTARQIPTINEDEEYQPDMEQVQRPDFEFSRSSSPTGTTFTRDSFGPVVAMQHRALPRRNTF